ncbi:c-type cytochrome biogenesis protein CcsB [Pseudonocardiaceae bacterium YIM PH 21723]|nr:c-type cytochrome biogenesis protein CcsB [Pseudonocardiaceae bacterium YIM PH 21723]
MPGTTIDLRLAALSDWTYISTIAIYFLAMVLYAVELAFSRKRAPEKELVAAGAVVVPSAEATPASAARPERSLPDRVGRMAVAFTVLGALLHVSSLVLRGLAVDRVPWGNVYEYISSVCAVAVIAYLVFLRRHPVRRLGAYVLLPLIVLMAIGGKWLYAQAAPLVPALRSYWIVIHVSAAIISSGVLLIAGVASVLYLIRKANDENPRRFARIAEKLPEASVLDRLAYRTTIFTFPIWTFAIVCGAIWAESAWGRYWGWDPKETCAFISWVFYACFLHARATAGFRDKTAAWINVGGFAVTVFNLFFINFVLTGLHSYAGVG